MGKSFEKDFPKSHSKLSERVKKGELRRHIDSGTSNNSLQGFAKTRYAAI
jgi:hypothetical protein